MSEQYIRELIVARELAVRAGKEVMRIRGGGELGVEMKPGDEPVTLADQLASELIVKGLRAAFPEDPVISEEVPATPAELGVRRVWLVDPIDGTKDFIRGGDGFAVMIGLLVDAVPVLGVVHQPTLERTFYGTPESSYVVTPGVAPQALAVSTIASAAEARLVASASHRSADIDRVKSTLGIENELNVGSVGVKLCLISMGVRDLYVNPAAKTKAWDTCAPEAILRGAGGTLTDLFGAPVEYRTELAHKRGLVGSNGHVHAEVVGKLSPLFAQMRP
ncbi:3'(2'),5'-bisphosphate nucleotidase CysQ [soil metagenome]